MNQYPVATIDLTALRHNLSRVRNYAPASKAMAVIKADAYGHGVVDVARALEQCDAFAVARLTEGLLLRQHGFEQPIVLLDGVASAEDVLLAAENTLSPVFHHQSQIDLLESLTLPQPLQFCWLMVDSGMRRLGIKPEYTEVALARLKSSANVSGEIGLMSHFANSDLVGDPRNQQQLDHMLNLRQTIGVPLCLANSAAIMSLPDSHQDWVRPGLMLYGISPFDDRSAEELGLKPVMQLKTRLISVYDLQAGDEVGYGGDWIASEPTRIGVASIGYGDGYNRHLSGKGQVLVSGHPSDVLGRVSMDSICINLNGLENAKIGDEVVLWGHENLPVEEVARLAGTIPYELVTVVCKRVHRHVING